MAPPPPSPLLAVLLTVESYRGATLVYRWPPAPSLFKRHSRVTYWRGAGGGGDAAPDPAHGAAAAHGAAPATAWDMARDRAMREEQGGSATDTSASDDAFSGASDLDLDGDFGGDEGDTDTDARSATDDGNGGGDDDTSASSDVGAAPLPSSFRSRLGSSSLLAGPGSGGTRSRSRPAPLRDPTAVPPSADRTAASASRTRRARRAYDSYLGYEETFLAQLLSPRPDGCHRKFELVVDDIAFVGHPVCVGADGRWDTSAAPQADSSAADEPTGPRGRAGAPRSAASRASSPSATGRLNATAPAGLTAGSGSASSSSSSGRGVSAFHLVLVLDRPDPTAGTPQLDISAWCRLYHDAVAFKLTAALWEEERRDAYVSRESARLAALKETARDRGDTFKSYLATSLRTSSLARLMRALQTSLAQGANAFVSVNDNIEAHLQLPPILRDPARLSRMREVETCLDFNDPLLAPGAGGRWAGSSDPWEEATRTTGPMLLPWKTLLVFGRGHERRPLDSSSQSSDEDDPEDDEENGDDAREGGIEVWARRFTNLLKPTLSGIPTFAELADLLGWDLHDDVYPMVRHLIYYREARVVDVPRVHSTYAVSPLFDLGDLRFLTHGWHRAFPTLPSLPVFLAMLSASLRPFAVHFSRAERQTALDALVWLLRHDVVVQMHVRLRLIATEAVKRTAARKRAEERAARRERRVLAEQRRVKRRERRAAAAREAAHARAAAVEDVASTGLVADDSTKARGRSREREAMLSAAPPQTRLAETGHKSRASSFAGSIDAHSPSVRATGIRDAASATARSSELQFERRKVLRSRSPSMLFSRQTGPGSFNTAPSASSRPGTPRGRAASLREGEAPDGLEGSSSGSHIGFGQAAAHSTEPSRRRRSRSPSRARMRVTGFGDTEEVHVEDNADAQPVDSGQPSRRPNQFGTADAAASLLSRPRTGPAPSSSEAPSLGSGSGGDSLLGSGGGGSSGARRGQAGTENLSDDVRRLSLVGEDGEEDWRAEQSVAPSAALADDLLSDDSVLSDDSRSSRAIDQDAHDAEHEEADSEIDEWEWEPVASIIAEPSRASGEENEWITAMVEGHEPWLVNRLFSLLPYLNGRHTIDEIVYREEMRRRELRALLGAFKDDVLTFVHP